MKLSTKYLEILIYRLTIWLLKRGYGANCKTSDLEDFKDDWVRHVPVHEAVVSGGRCGSCRAKETIIFLEEAIKLIKM